MLYFTSDTHWGHKRMIQYSHRDSFLCDKDKQALEEMGGKWHTGNWKDSERYTLSDESVKIMDDKLIENINATVGEEDILWHLGDISFNFKDETAGEYFNRIAAYKIRIKCNNFNLVYGNHDRDVIGCLFNQAVDKITLNYKSTLFVLDHYAHAVWDQSHRKAIHLYGHSHAEAEEWLDKIMPDRRSMDVGVDNAYRLLGEYRPFSFKEVIDLMKHRKGHFKQV
jgi:calcineurin-like phosphoesterase family protein